MDAKQDRTRDRQPARRSAAGAGRPAAAAVQPDRPKPDTARFRRRGSRILHATLAPAVAWALACGPQLPAAEAPERVVVVTIDTLRADHVGAYGAEAAITPQLDRIAESGVRFADVSSPAPVTLPSHTSLFSARDPSEHGVRHNGLFQVGPDLPLLAERLRDAGFASAAFVGAFVLDRRYGLDRGFDVYDDTMDARGTSGTFGYAERTADQVVDAALGWLEQAPDRFFLWTHFYDPHADYQPPTGFALALPGRPYAGEIAFADRELGRLVDALDARWPDGRTLLVVTSDHGESLGEHDEATHSYLLYQGTQRIPLLMRGPGLPAGRVVEAPVRLIDVAPTILAMLGLEPLAGASGQDLLGHVAGETPEPSVAYMETLAPHFDFGWASLLGVRQGRYKLIRGTELELYDLEADPGETRNLAAEQPETRAALEREITLRIERGGAPMPTRGLGDDERERLVALGYLLPEDTGSVDDWLEGADPRTEVTAIQRITEAGKRLEEGRWNDALALVEGLEEGDLPRWTRAAAYLGLGRLEDAEEQARAAILPGAPSIGPRVMLGRVLAAQGRIDEALAVFAEAQELAPGDARPPLGAGRALLSVGRREEARAALDRAAAGRGNKAAEARRERAALALEDGDCATADRLLASDEADASAWRAEVRLALAEAHAGRSERAVRRLERAIAAGSGLPILWSALATVHAQAGDLDAAVAAREEALRAAPEEAWAANDLAYSLAKAGRDLDRALELAEGASASGNPNALDTLASVHLARGEARQALAAADRALAATDDPEVVGHLQLLRGRALLAEGRPDAARQAARASAAALSQRPDWADDLEDLGADLSLPLELPAPPPIPRCN